jgi:hypothetical protein
MRLSDNFKLSYGVSDVPVWEDGLGNAVFNNNSIVTSCG